MAKKIRSVIFAFLFIMFCVPAAVYAQTGFSDTDVTDTPIDGGISLLVIAGIGYGAKKLHEKRKQDAIPGSKDK